MNHTYIVGAGLESDQPAYLNAYTIPAQPLSAPSDELLQMLGGAEAASGVRVNTRTSLGYPAFWRGLNLIANTVAKLPLYTQKIGNDGGSLVDKDHPAYRLLRKRPNRNMTASVFKRTMTLHAQLYGNGYAAILRDNAGRPTELCILDPHATYPVKWIPKAGEEEVQVWYVTEIEGKPLRLRQEDVLHIRHLSLDGLIGISVIDIMREALGLGMAARAFGSRFFGEGANASGILMIPGHIKPEAQNNIIKRWSSMATGIAKSHKVALLQDGVKFEKLTIPPNDSQFLETRKFEIVEIANIVGVPPHKLGDSSRAAYNSIEAENRNALDESYDPWLNTWEEECDAKLLTEEQQVYETHNIEFDRSVLQLADYDKRIAGFKTLREIGVLNTNNILTELSLPTIGPEGDKRYIPSNWQLMTDKPPEQTAAKPAPPPPASEESQQVDLHGMFSPLIAERVSRLADIEAKQLRAALAKGKDLAGSAPGWYAQHRNKLQQSVAPVLGVMFQLQQRRQPDRAAHELAATWCRESIAHLTSAPVTAQRIDELIQSFPERTARLVAALNLERKSP